MLNDETVVRAFEDAGAVSPDTACPLGDLTGVDAAAFVQLISRRVIREGASGRYYLHATTERARRRAYVLAVFAAAVVFVPAMLLQALR